MSVVGFFFSQSQFDYWTKKCSYADDIYFKCIDFLLVKSECLASEFTIRDQECAFFKKKKKKKNAKGNA